MNITIENVSEVAKLSKEYENYDMELEEFVELVNDEYKEYRPKLRRYAKTHSLAQCVVKTGEWFDDYRIAETTEKILDHYAKTLYPNQTLESVDEEVGKLLALAEATV